MKLYAWEVAVLCFGSAEKKKSQTGGALAGRAAVEHHAICDQQAQMQSEWFRAHANSCWQLNQSKLAWCESNLLSRWSPRQNTDTVPLIIIIIIIMVLLEIILQSTLEALWRLTRFLRTWNNNRTDRKDAEKNQNTEGRGVKLCYQREGNVTDFNNCVPKGHIERRPEWTLWAIRNLLDISAERQMRII